MKKIALFSLLVCMGIVGTGFARTCGPTVVGFDGIQSYADDEFLYENEKQFEDAKYGYQNSGGQNSGDGRAWECDTHKSGGCAEGDKTKLMPAGHYFEGKRVDVSKVYQCEDHVFNDVWVEVPQGEKCTTSWGDLAVGRQFKRRRSTAECSGMEFTEARTLGVEWAVACIEENHVVCKPTKCIDGYTANLKTGKCDKVCPDCDKIVDDCDKWKNDDALYKCCINARNGTADVTFNNGICECKDKETKKWNPNTGKCEDTQKTKTCKESRTTAEGKACCDLPESEAKWDGKNCKCSDANATFKIDADGRGKCEGGASNDDDNSQECWYTFNANIRCANGNSYSKAQKYPLGYYDEQTCKKFIQQYNDDAAKVIELYKQICGGSYTVVNDIPSGPDATAVSNAKDTLNKFFANAESEASVWKDSEGKFNTARLASDLTAGVVLGTVGGVVSGVVIKKKQVEKGFEVLHCAVGGQKIADWGDEFSVGLQR